MTKKTYVTTGATKGSNGATEGTSDRGPRRGNIWWGTKGNEGATECGNGATTGNEGAGPDGRVGRASQESTIPK